MGVLPDWMIERGIVIEPFSPQFPRKGTVSYGLTSYGYDARVGRTFKVCTERKFDGVLTAIDPKDIRRFDIFEHHEGDSCVIPPHGFALAETVEYFEIPRGVLAVCLGKSTYARCGIIVNVTPLEPEWRGKVTVEISNTTPRPVVVHANEGIMQVVFLTGVMPCNVSYDDKRGKYQDQSGLTLPIVS